MYTFILKPLLKFIWCIVAGINFYIFVIFVFILKIILYFKIDTGFFLLQSKPKKIEFIRFVYNGEEEWLTEYRIYYSFFHWYYRLNSCCKILKTTHVWKTYQ